MTPAPIPSTSPLPFILERGEEQLWAGAAEWQSNAVGIDRQGREAQVSALQGTRNARHGSWLDQRPSFFFVIVHLSSVDVGLNDLAKACIKSQV